MPQCESRIFFPDDPRQVPQFNGCPREAQTTRHTWRMSIRKGEPIILKTVIRLCGKCAAVWDGKDRAG